MKIVCETLDSFLENLKAVEPTAVFEQRVWMDVLHRTKSEAVNDVVFQASAVIQTESGSEYLLQLGKDCGKDYMDSGDREGTANAEHFSNELKSWCIKRGLVVLPGIISE